MSYERDLDETVSQFFLNTCRQSEPPQLNENVVRAATGCAMFAAAHPNADPEAHWIPLTTGSVAEFYVEPMLPHVGDIDLMLHLSTQLATPRGQSPPTQLPAEFHNYVKVFEIIDSHLPGYVYLQLRHLLMECNDEGKYNAVQYDRKCYLSNRSYQDDEINVHGPALLAVVPRLGTSSSHDLVFCLRCLSWPSQAADWPTRHRNYGWPDSTTVDRVVNNGCDVVRVAHRQCKEHEWMGEAQWRLSFSRAEIVLMNSWTPVQQIVYHMLRFFMKTERLTDSADNSGADRLSNYHIKTLILWASELKPETWWTDDLNLVRICVELLHNLVVWLSDAWYPQYFISDCNLIDNSFNMTNIGQLISLDHTWFSTWFIDNYIRKCSHLCPDHISRLCDDISTGMKLQRAVSAIVARRLNSSLFDFPPTLAIAELSIATLVTVMSCVSSINEFTKIDSRLSDYVTGVTFLHVASKLLRHSFNDELMNILTTVLGHFVGPRRYSNNFTSKMSLIQSSKLMKVVANNPRSTVQLIEIELSKAYLYRALRCKDTDSDSIYCLANVYLAVLYYTTGQYQMATERCKLVTRSQDHSHCNPHVVQGELLPKIDDDIDVVLGLAVFYQQLRTAALNQQDMQHVTVFTTELFAHYMDVKCCQFTQSDKFKQYKIYFCITTQLFIGDMLLYVL